MLPISWNLNEVGGAVGQSARPRGDGQLPSAAGENEARRIARRDKNKIRLMENDMMSAPFAFPTGGVRTLCRFAPVAQGRGGHQSAPAARRWLAGSDAVHGDATEKLGIKVRGFLRQDFAGSGDFHDLLDLTWI